MFLWGTILNTNILSTRVCGCSFYSLYNNTSEFDLTLTITFLLYIHMEPYTIRRVVTLPYFLLYVHKKGANIKICSLSFHKVVVTTIHATTTAYLKVSILFCVFIPPGAQLLQETSGPCHWKKIEARVVWGEIFKWVVIKGKGTWM
jgi:hypothetical protein